MTEPRTLLTADEVTLEAEVARATGDERAGAVICHPHPTMGGTMRSIVVGALFAALPTAGVTCLRFNFRGVEGSGGAYDEGRGERVDAAAAVAALAGELAVGAPLLLAGWSFGADIALSTLEPAIAGWMAIAPPLHFVAERAAIAGDPRPKLLVLCEHDEVRSPTEVAAEVATWSATTIEVVSGASHFFMGRTDRLVELALAFVDELTGA
jgi:alpha/beta superfamily hydrolase